MFSNKSKRTRSRRQSKTPKPGIKPQNTAPKLPRVIPMSLSEVKIGKLIGQGSFGEVYEATHIDPAKAGGYVYALKMLSYAQIMKEEKLHHVLIEKEVLTSIHNEYLVDLFACFQDRNKLYLLLESVPNGELADFMSFRGALSMPEVIFLAAEIVEILEMLWKKGIVHRDLKPENLLICSSNHLKVIDFGTALFKKVEGNEVLFNKVEAIRARNKNPDSEEAQENTTEGERAEEEPSSMQKEEEDDLEDYETRATEEGDDGEAEATEEPEEDQNQQTNQRDRSDSFVGTPLYLSPEMLDDDVEVSFPADLWAFGIILYQLITGQIPYSDVSTEFSLFEKVKDAELDMRNDFNKDAIDLLNLILVKEPNERLGYAQLNAGECTNPFKIIKNHPFFKDVNWVNLRHQKAEIDTRLGRESEFALEMPLSSANYKHGRKVQMSGRVRKYTKVIIIYDTRHLYLYKDHTMAYFRPSDGEKRGEIILTNQCYCYERNNNCFDLFVPERNRTFYFKSVECPAARWVNAIMKSIAQLGTRSEAGGGMIGISSTGGGLSLADI